MEGLSNEFGSIKAKAYRRVITPELEEGIAEVVKVQGFLVPVDDVGHVEEDLVEAELLGLGVPREALYKAVEVLGDITKSAQVLTYDNDDVGTYPSGLRDEL